MDTAECKGKRIALTTVDSWTVKVSTAQVHLCVDLKNPPLMGFTQFKPCLLKGQIYCRSPVGGGIRIFSEEFDCWPFTPLPSETLRSWEGVFCPTMTKGKISGNPDPKGNPPHTVNRWPETFPGPPANVQEMAQLEANIWGPMRG